MRTVAAAIANGEYTKFERNPDADYPAAPTATEPHVHIWTIHERKRGGLSMFMRKTRFANRVPAHRFAKRRNVARYRVLSCELPCPCRD